MPSINWPIVSGRDAAGRFDASGIPKTDERLSIRTRVDACGCHVWIGVCSSGGYGIFKVGGKRVRVHRMAWELRNGPIPEGMSVLHKCDNPPCLNPEHLFLGSQAANMADKTQKRRQSFTRGEDNGRAKLDAADVLEILSSDESSRAIAERFGVGKSTIGYIRRGESWRHLR